MDDDCVFDVYRYTCTGSYYYSTGSGGGGGGDGGGGGVGGGSLVEVEVVEAVMVTYRDNIIVTR